MRINADFSKRVLVHSATMEWVQSPVAGVERRPLDRIGGEVARATSIVRFAAGSRFSAHTHGGGEEFVVLDGVFEDEEGDFPAGSYVRNPPGTSHAPGSGPGCTIFVKLWQFAPDDREPVRVAMDADAAVEDPAREGVRVAVLFENAEERVCLEVWEPGAAARWVVPGGAELLVLAGGGNEGGEALEVGSWLRLPDGAEAAFTAGPEGARLWVKTGHLRHIRVPAAA